MGCLKLTYRLENPTFKVVHNSLKISSNSCAGQYRFGFNGMERDDEVKGKGIDYTTDFRQLDVRIGKWFSKDLVVKPFESPYAYAFNNPIYFSDPTGLDPPERLGLFKRLGNALKGKGYLNKANKYAVKNNIDETFISYGKNSVTIDESSYSINQEGYGQDMMKFANYGLVEKYTTFGKNVSGNGNPSYNLSPPSWLTNFFNRMIIEGGWTPEVLGLGMDIHALDYTDIKASFSLLNLGGKLSNGQFSGKLGFVKANVKLYVRNAVYAKAQISGVDYSLSPETSQAKIFTGTIEGAVFGNGGGYEGGILDYSVDRNTGKIDAKTFWGNKNFISHGKVNNNTSLGQKDGKVTVTFKAFKLKFKIGYDFN